MTFKYVQDGHTDKWMWQRRLTMTIIVLSKVFVRDEIANEFQYGKMCMERYSW